MLVWIKLVPDAMQPGLLRPPFPIPLDAWRGLARPEDCVSLIGAPGDIRNTLTNDGTMAVDCVLVEIADADAEKARPYCVPESAVPAFDRELTAVVCEQPDKPALSADVAWMLLCREIQALVESASPDAALQTLNDAVARGIITQAEADEITARFGLR